MLLKMGWNGGGLGKSGKGIVEPIEPNAYYTDRMGFGNDDRTKTIPRESIQKASKPIQKAREPIQRAWEPIQRAWEPIQRAWEPIQINRQFTPPIEFPWMSKKKRPLTKSAKRQMFKEEVLHRILEFVLRDDQIEMAFDVSVSKCNRKIIHNLVEEMTEYREIISLEEDDVYQMDQTQRIVYFNEYVLCTQSDGTHPNRQLFIYKDAPEHVYLVTAQDLRFEETIQETFKNKQVTATTPNKKTKALKRKLKKRMAQNCQPPQVVNSLPEDMTNKHLNKDDEKTINAKSKIDGTIISKPEELKDEQCIKENFDKKLGLDSIDSILDNSILDAIQTDQGLNSDKETHNTEDTSDSVSSITEPKAAENKKIDESQFNLDLIHTNENFKPDKTIDSVQENVNISKNTTELSLTNHKQNITNEITPQKNFDDVHHDEADAVIGEKEIYNEDEIELIEEEVVRRMIEFFLEFANSNLYKEFRLLGKFNEFEYNGLVKFFACCANKEEADSEEKLKLQDAWIHSASAFELKINLNGSLVIHKIVKRKRSKLKIK